MLGLVAFGVLIPGLLQLLSRTLIAGAMHQLHQSLPTHTLGRAAVSTGNALDAPLRGGGQMAEPGGKTPAPGGSTTVKRVSQATVPGWNASAVHQPGQDDDDDDTVHVGFLAMGSAFLSQARKVVVIIEATTNATVHYHFITNSAVPPNDRDGQLFVATMTALKLHYFLYAVPDSVGEKVRNLSAVFNFTGHIWLYVIKLFLHRVLPPSVGRIIILDTDVIQLDDIDYLWDVFDHFGSSTMFGLAAEQQPTYWGCYMKSRSSWHPKDPQIGNFQLEKYGFPGFNGGVQIHDLDAIRRNDAYNKLLDWPRRLLAMVPTRQCKDGGIQDLGDQDLFSVIADVHPEWFKILPCAWNWQACRYWSVRKRLPREAQEQFKCPSGPRLFHGNCDHIGLHAKPGWKHWVFRIQNHIMWGRIKEAREELQKNNFGLLMDGSRSSDELHGEESNWARLEKLQSLLAKAKAIDLPTEAVRARKKKRKKKKKKKPKKKDPPKDQQEKKDPPAEEKDKSKAAAEKEPKDSSKGAAEHKDHPKDPKKKAKRKGGKKKNNKGKKHGDAAPDQKHSAPAADQAPTHGGARRQGAERGRLLEQGGAERAKRSGAR